MKPIHSITTIFLIFLLACAGERPESVLQDYLEADMRADYERAYELISSQDRSVKTLQEYRAESEKVAGIRASLASRISYEVLDVNRDGDRAVAKVEVTAPDFSSIVGELMGAAFQSAFGEEEADAGARMAEALKKYEDADLPTTTNVNTYNLVREAGGWRVFLNWKKTALVQEAAELAENDQLEAALYAYRRALSIDTTDAELQNKIEELEAELTIAREREAYRDQVEVYDVQAGYYNSLLDGRIPGVEFKLRNKGDRTLRKVVVTAYFKDENDNTIYETDFIPVLVSDYSFENNKPLKPGYVWRQERGRFFAAKDCPEEWAKGEVEVKVTEVVFLEEEG